MDSNRLVTLSGLLEKHAQPDPEGGIECSADACLLSQQYEDALSGYYGLDMDVPRIATKASYCEMMLGRADDARTRLTALIEDLEPDGIGLLCQMIRHVSDYKERQAQREAVWPHLRYAIAGDSVPMITATARTRDWWPADADDTDQRYRDIKRLFSLHPDSDELRLALRVEIQRNGGTPAEQLALLRESRPGVRISRHVWQQAIVAYATNELDEALSLLEEVQKRELGSEEPNQHLLFTVRLAMCEISANNNHSQAFADFDALIVDTKLHAEDRVTAVRVALAVACRLATNRVPNLATIYLSALEACDSKIDLASGQLSDDPNPVFGADWDTYGDPWPFPDLQPWKELLTNHVGEREAVYFRAAFVTNGMDLLEEDQPAAWWESLSHALGSIAGYESDFNGALLSLHAAIVSHRQRPSWSTVGRDWMTSEWLVCEAGLNFSHGGLTLAAASRNKTALRSFAKAAEKQLQTYLPAPELAYDRTEELIQALADKELGAEIYQLLRTASEGDDRPSVQFRFGFWAHTTKHSEQAKTAYARTLKKEPENFGAIYNSLILCKSHEDALRLLELEKFAIQYPDTDAEKKQRLLDQVSQAKERCRDHEGEKREIVRTELANQPTLRSTPVKLEEVSLRGAIALLALFRCAKAEPGDDRLPPFDKSDVSFSPANSCRRGIFDLIEVGLLAADPNSSVDAFSVSNGKIDGWYLGSIHWRLSPVAGELVEELRNINGKIPEFWRRDVEPVALELARGELTEYICHLSDERSWPAPENTEEVADLVRILANEVPISQAFYLTYLGAMSASDYKAKYRVGGQRAADMLIKRTGQRLEWLREGRLAPRVYDRPWRLPRSAISYALWGTVLNKGDMGFGHRISDALADLGPDHPRPSQSPEDEHP